MSEKLGEKHICPNCGRVIPPFTPVCPGCGFEFSDLEANLSSQLLAEKLEEADTDEEKAQAIETFPIPNTKGDLLEFLTALKPRIMNIYDPLCDSYFIKYQEVIEKAKVSFADDKKIRPFLDEFAALKAEREQKIAKADRKDWMSEHLRGLIITAAIIVAAIVVGAVVFATRDTAANTPDLCIQQVNQSINKDDLKAARKYVETYKNAKDDIAEAYFTLLAEYLDNGMWEEAKSLVDFYGMGEYAQPMSRGLYNYCLSVGDYEGAEEYVNVEAKPSNEEYYAYMEDCVRELCKAGKKDEAKEFVTKKAVFFAANTSGSYTKTRVTDKLNRIINNY